MGQRRQSKDARLDHGTSDLAFATVCFVSFSDRSLAWFNPRIERIVSYLGGYSVVVYAGYLPEQGFTED